VVARDRCCPSAPMQCGFRLSPNVRPGSGVNRASRSRPPRDGIRLATAQSRQSDGDDRLAGVVQDRPQADDRWHRDDIGGSAERRRSRWPSSTGPRQTAPKPATRAEQLRRVNLIERQRDQSESNAVSCARPTAANPLPPSLPPLTGPTVHTDAPAGPNNSGSHSTPRGSWPGNVPMCPGGWWRHRAQG
jgi:hypothetical protein